MNKDNTGALGNGLFNNSNLNDLKSDLLGSDKREAELTLLTTITKKKDIETVETKKVMQSFEMEKDEAQPNKDEPFLVPFWQMPFKQVMAETLYFLKFGFSMALNNSSNVVIQLICFIYIGQLDDATLEASMGLAVSYFSFFFLALCLACYEVTGIQCAKWYGNRNFYMMSVSLGQGFILSGIVTTFAVIMFWFAEEILVAVDIAPSNAVMVGQMMKALIPGTILMNINFQLISFCTAQKIERAFGISNMVSIIICIIITGWLVNDCNMGLYAYPICKTIIEVVNLTAILFVMFFQIEKES